MNSAEAPSMKQQGTSKTTEAGAHEETVRIDIHEMVRRLLNHLGPTSVALLAGAKDRKIAHGWARADGPTPRDEAQQRLQMATRIWVLISAAEGEHVARAWFIGSNPRLGERSPLIALREGSLVEAKDAAMAFVDGTDE